MRVRNLFPFFFQQHLLCSCTNCCTFLFDVKLGWKKQHSCLLLFYFRLNAGKSCRELWFAEQDVPLVTSWGHHRQVICWSMLRQVKVLIIWQTVPVKLEICDVYLKCIAPNIQCMIWTQWDVIIFLFGWRASNFSETLFFSDTVKHSIFEIWKANRKRDLDSSAGMSGSVYVTQLMTLYAVSLKGCRKSCAFMSFLDKLEWGVGEKMFPGRRTWEQPSTCPQNNLEGHKIKNNNNNNNPIISECNCRSAWFQNTR